MSIILPSEPASEEPTADQRRDTRFAFRLPVTLVRGREEIPLTTEDISYHGLFLETDEDIPLRHLVRLKLLIPPFHRALDAFGMAVHTPASAARDRPRGVGVQLFALDRAARTVWGNFVTRVRFGDFASDRISAAELAAMDEIRFLPPEIAPSAEGLGDVVWIEGGKRI